MPSCASLPAVVSSRRCSSRPWPRVLRSSVGRLVTVGILAMATTLSGAGSASAASAELPDCEAGVFCSWTDVEYRGAVYEADLRTIALEECIPLPEGRQARSFANSLDRPVTAYQDADCSSEADFTTYPGRTHTPHTPFLVRAIQIWSH
ncbi:hypothetical protein GIY23_02775 [Allosaccharopolyspora coralli]|uniref:Peptidase inhibitor family I36 n=1 Tax=Allosaccharopolyspora coralli TaxID=2665642 RepID=A0A5Q3Q2B6_9PSEU|nr:peptidase inhibitor family I36 protein [Allosaccharopolyspora coralli]QGK68622.1 hypothetical protein GIY23_02775 [Allosaccharopolyspora coralli]